MTIKKSMQIVLILIIVSISGCNSSNDEYGSDSKYLTSLQDSRQRGELIIECIKNSDNDTLKEMFCENMKNSQEFDGKIEQALNFMDGEIISYDKPSGGRSLWKNEPAGVKEEVIDGEIENIKTSAGKTYRIAFGYYTVNKNHLDYIGIFDFSIFDEDAYLEGIGYTKIGRYDISLDESSEE